MEALVRVLSLTLLLGACADGTNNTDLDTDTDESGTNSTTDTGERGPEGEAYFDGVVVDESGAPLEGLEVRFCRELCKTIYTDASGAFAYDQIAGGYGSFEVLPEASNQFVSFAPVELPEPGTTSVNVTMYDLQNEVALPTSTSEVEIAPGLHLTLAASDLEPPTFVDPADTIGALDVTADSIPIGLDGEVIAVWYMTPFDHHAPNGLGVRIEDTWTLDPAGTYELHQGIYKTYSWEKVGDMTLADDGAGGSELTTDGTLGLISTLVLLKTN
jgi:hypothetical protein